MPPRTLKDAPPVPPVMALFAPRRSNRSSPSWSVEEGDLFAEEDLLASAEEEDLFAITWCWPRPQTISALLALLPVRDAHRSSCTYHPSLEPFGRHQFTQFVPSSRKG